MRHLPDVVFGLLACLLGAAGCSGEGGPARLPFDPFGTEPSGGSNEAPPPSGGETLEQACARACAHIASSCPSMSDPSCPSSCASGASSFPACAAEFQAFVVCIAMAPLNCTDNTVPACNAAEQRVSDCVSQTGVSGGGSSSGSGGSAPPQ